MAKDKSQQAYQLGEEIPKLRGKGERDYKPHPSVGIVDTGGKPKIHGNRNKRDLRNRVKQGLPQGNIQKCAQPGKQAGGIRISHVVAQLRCC